MGKRKKKQRGEQTASPRRPRPIQTLGDVLEKHIWWVLVGLILVGGLCSLLVFDPNLDTNGDNARYIVLGISLIQGQGLSKICMPGAPPDIMVPFGYPLLLAPFLALFPDHYVPLKLLSMLLFLLSLPLLFHIIKGWGGSLWLALGVAVLSAINLNLLDFGHQVMTEIPFLFFSLLGIFALLRSLRCKSAQITRKEKVLLGLSILSLVFAYYIRSVGVVLLVALISFLILRKRYRLALLAGLAILCLVLPWTLRNQAVADGGSYADVFLLKNAYNPALGKITAGDILARMKSNLNTYAIFVIPQALFPSLSPSAGYRGSSELFYILGLLATLVTLLGFILKVRRAIGFLELYIFLFLGVCLLWPQMWSGMRFLIPVVPFLSYYFLVGLWSLAKKLGSKLHPLWGKSLIWLLVTLMIISSFSGLVGASRGVKGYPPQWHNYFLVAEWCREHTPQESIFVARKPWLFYLSARRLVMNYPYTTDTEEMLSFMVRNQVDYVILDGFSWTGTTARYLWPAVAAHRDNFQAVYGLDNPKTWVLKTVGFPHQKEGE
jgi:hypothetical protein